HRSNLTGQWRNKQSGLTVKPQFFWNYSDNSYTMNNLETPSGEGGQLLIGDFERFHDTFQSYLGSIELGFTDVSWADQFLIGIGYGTLDREIQTSSRGSRVSNEPFPFRLPAVGEATQDEENTRFTLRYNKKNFLTKGLSLNLFSSFNNLNRTSIDTASRAYNWEGKIINTQRSTGEFNLPKTRFLFDQQSLVSNLGLSYRLAQNHELNANFTWSNLDRQGRDTFIASEDNPFDQPNSLDKKVAGLSYDITAVKGKLETSFLVKYFNLNILARDARQFEFGQFEVVDLRTVEERIGYGIATRYDLTNQWQIKASYEKTYRLPEPFEIFGDGLLILANPEIQPESSDNLNVNASFTHKKEKDWSFTYGLNGFFRWTDNMIFPALGGQLISYENQRNIYIRGVELDLKANWKNQLTIGLNGTYQDVLNNQEFNAISGRSNPFFGERMFNTPYLFANATANYQLKEKLRSKFKWSFNYSFNYVEEFFLNYPNVAQGGSRFTVPTQLLHHVSTTFSSMDKKYNLSLECRNVTNAEAFDDFALQKPGRAFFIKVRYFLNANI
ncbi:MAG: TonB-dependent receptor, partial [Bacteroidota bacterium]